MIKNVIMSYENVLVGSKRDFDQEEIWDTLSTYFGYQGIDVSGYDLKKYFDKAVISMNNTKKVVESDIDIEDVFYKMFKKFGVKTKRIRVKEFSVLFQLLTTTSAKVKTKIKPVLEGDYKQETRFYTIANGQANEIEREMRLLKLNKVIEEAYCSSVIGVKKPHKKLLETLMDQEKLSKKETLYITNDLEEVKMAQKFGLSVAFLGDAVDEKVDCVGDGQAIMEYIKGNNK